MSYFKLSNDEENEIVGLAKDFKENGNMDSLERIYNILYQLMRSICKKLIKMYKDFVEFDDLMSISFMGLRHLLSERVILKTNSITSFIYYGVYSYVNHSCISAMKAYFMCIPIDPNDDDVFFSAKYSTNFGEQLKERVYKFSNKLMAEFINENGHNVFSKTSPIEFINKCSDIDPMSKDIIIEYTHEKKTFEVISKKWGKSRETIRTLYTNGIVKLREYIMRSEINELQFERAK